MTDKANLDRTIDELGRAFEEFKETQKQRADDIEKRGYAKTEVDAKLDKVMEAMAKLEDSKEALEERLRDTELKLDTPDLNTDGYRTPEPERKHIEAFRNWLRNPRDYENQVALKHAETEFMSTKEVSGAADATGGYAIPEIISRRIGERVTQISPMRQISRVVTAGSPDYKELLDIRGETGGWAAEAGSRSETTTPSLAECAPTFGTAYAYPFATEESLNDLIFNVEDWLVRSSSRILAKNEGDAFVSGDGTAKPTGFIGTPVSTADDASPARAYGTLQYTASGGAGTFPHAPGDSPPVYGGDKLIDCQESMKPAYQAGAVWTMSNATRGVVRKFKDVDGDYLYRPGIAAGVPPTLMGSPVVIDQSMPAIAANSISIAFGNFMEGYLIVDLVGMRITRDEITTPGKVKFYIRRRVGGKVYNDEAIKVIKMAAS